MPRLKSKPQSYNAHRVRYGDIHLQENLLPEWLQELEEVEYVQRNHAEGNLQVQTPKGWVRAEVGEWILFSDQEELSVVSAEAVASNYDLLEA